MDEMNHHVQLGQAELGKWKDKWIQEGAKCDGIKRECLQVGVSMGSVCWESVGLGKTRLKNDPGRCQV
jgi:hypothetical protein